MSELTARQQDILQALALLLETTGATRITTARLAQQVGVSEAALYRHFPSKARMFEGLIEFIEATLFSRINLILEEDTAMTARMHKVLTLVLAFAERNPGLCRILVGDALTGEAERLRVRMAQFYDRLELQLKQIVRESSLREASVTELPAAEAASLLLAVVEGRIAQYVRSAFKRKPTDHWDTQWQLLTQQLFTPTSQARVEREHG
jgi:TetR/AcrR family transcriptional regulator